jgi:nucleoid-associated protein YgaU
VIGTAADRAGRVLVPRVLLKLVAGSAGLGVLVAPAAAGAQPPPRPAPTATSAPSAPTLATVPGPVWPSDPAGASMPGPRWPSTPSTPPADHPDHPAEPAPDSRPADTVRVRPGDSLWLIAARRLGPAADPDRIATEWPRWYAANRAVIGSDPDLIRPGQVLHAPAPSSQEAP